MPESTPPSVFVVDDDRGLVRLIEKALRNEGYTTSHAYSADEAVAWLEANKPDLMLLDLKLENVEARNIIDQLVSNNRSVPFIIITGQGDERVAVEMMKRGAIDYLIKDIHFQDIIPTLVRRALDQIDRDRKLAGAEQERMRLEQQIIEISERERRRFGQDLHDGLGQHLTGIELMTEALEQKLAGKNKAEAARAGDIARHVREAIRQTRALARGLSPVETDANGLMSALTTLADSASTMFRIKCHFECPTQVLVTNDLAATHLFRIAQEALSNAVKHGHARDVEIKLSEAPNSVCLAVGNDGASFPPREQRGNGLGLRIMNYRAAVIGGALTIGPGQRHSTVVTCVVPKSALDAPGPPAMEIKA